MSSASVGSRAPSSSRARAPASARLLRRDREGQVAPAISNVSHPAVQTMEQRTKLFRRPRPQVGQEPARHPALGLRVLVWAIMSLDQGSER
eukprot:1333428-Pyramimonas_sp.AAC.1